MNPQNGRCEKKRVHGHCSRLSDAHADGTSCGALSCLCIVVSLCRYLKNQVWTDFYGWTQSHSQARVRFVPGKKDAVPENIARKRPKGGRRRHWPPARPRHQREATAGIELRASRMATNTRAVQLAGQGEPWRRRRGVLYRWWGTRLQASTFTLFFGCRMYTHARSSFHRFGRIILSLFFLSFFYLKKLGKTYKQ